MMPTYRIEDSLVVTESSRWCERTEQVLMQHWKKNETSEIIGGDLWPKKIADKQ